jgi:hypothetical protein
MDIHLWLFSPLPYVVQYVEQGRKLMSGWSAAASPVLTGPPRLLSWTCLPIPGLRGRSCNTSSLPRRPPHCARRNIPQNSARVSRSPPSSSGLSYPSYSRKLGAAPSTGVALLQSVNVSWIESITSSGTLGPWADLIDSTSLLLLRR